MEDIIPFIIVIVISIIGSINSSKKKAKNASKIAAAREASRKAAAFDVNVETTTDTPPLFNFGQSIDLEKQEQDKTIKETPPPMQSVVKPVTEPVTMTPYSNNEGFITEQERNKMVAKEGLSMHHQKKADKKQASTINTVESQPKGQISNEENQDILEDFDLHQAVIYSEILKAKYI